jgi:hypothetical protein
MRAGSPFGNTPATVGDDPDRAAVARRDDRRTGLRYN